ncbi:MAG: hypothetical protein U9Q07_07260, partial [Planctomycetota bacterium]|nr:hypothetical protein [Planctomycetota bacterium]
MSSIARTFTIDDPSRQGLTLYRGGYLQIDGTLEDSDESAVDITGATIKFTVWDIEAGANEFQIVAQPITTATWSTNVVTFTAEGHGYSIGDAVTVEDCGNAS